MSDQATVPEGTVQAEQAVAPDPASTSSREAHHAKPAPGASSGVRSIHWARATGATLLGILTGLAAIGTFAGALIYYFPELRRDPPVALGATLSDVRLEERDVAIEEGVANRVSFTVEYIGYERKEGYVGYAVFDAADLKRVSPPANDANRVFREMLLEPEAPNDRASYSIDVPLPPSRQCVFVRVYIFGSPDEQYRLDYSDTEPFDTHESSNERCIALGVVPG